MGLTTILSLLAGIGLFLYGMNLMGDGLKNAAGASLERILQKLTSSRLKGLALGTAVTAIIQSSAATAIMCLGFVNAGIMNLSSAIPVVLGSNIGSTITGQILRLGDIGEQSIFLTMLKPSSMAPLLVAYGVVVLVFIKSRKKRLNSIASVLLGLGILFIGMSTMESSISPLRNDPNFQKIFFLFENPLLGILVGMLLTVVIQSSSASVGILQALSSTGAVTWAMAVPIILGQNLGKCFPVVLGSIGVSKDSKRLAFLHVLFNLIGVILIGGVIYIYQSSVGIPFWENPLNRGNVADFHSLFNIITALILIPFTNLFVKLSTKVIKDSPDQMDERHRLDELDELLLKTPAVAQDSAKRVTAKMGDAVVENFHIISDFFKNFDPTKIDLMERNEQFLDKAESKISDYLVKINTHALANQGNLETGEILRTVGDFERMGDYCIHIYDMIVFNQENNITFTPVCLEEIYMMNQAIQQILDLTVTSFRTHDVMSARMVEPLNEAIHSMKELMNARYIERLNEGQCSVQAGISLVEYLNSVERIAGHCSNIAVHAIRSRSQDSYFDTHSYKKKLAASSSQQFQDTYTEFETQFIKPLLDLPALDQNIAIEQQKIREAEALTSTQPEEVLPDENEIRKEAPDLKKENNKTKDKKKEKEKAKAKEKEKSKDKKHKK
ncbi:MAG: Na/Pi cotransporter family protein [Firmicutes bacterium]|nr:Na/Pi cotransporter family protein [Bacillota bacterium]